MNYDNETCEGCVYLSMNGSYCLNPASPPDDLSCDRVRPCDRCGLFAPSLECRKVRALESIAASTGGTVRHTLGTEDDA
jgi:hypothetical protein